MGTTPETRYAETPGGYIGYQVFGRGPRNLLFITNWATNVDVMWEEASIVRYFDRLGSFARVLFFDKRGSGVSDAVPLETPTSIEAWMDDARVIADVGASGPMVVLGDTEGGPMAMLFAATYPERVSALVLLNTYARYLRAPDYPIGIPARVAKSLAEAYERTWGTGEVLALTAPSIASDGRFKNWQARYERLSMPRRASRIMFEWVQQFDVRAVLPSIQAPTLVLQRQANRYYRAAYGRYLGKVISGATYLELPGSDCYPFYVNAMDTLAEIELFLTGRRAETPAERRLATVLFTDIVDSTGHAARLGDDRWRNLLEAHNALVRRQLARYQGREIETTGDGFLAIFDGPTRAVQCALSIVAAAPEVGIEVRAGIHTGELELVGEGVAGIAVHIAARVLAAARPGMVLTTSTVRDLAVGSGIEFVDRGTTELRGVPGRWQLMQPGA
jgi:class 3 adenylate cyclase/pimeloyl-ACP methyl ester carboxylesterase